MVDGIRACSVTDIPAGEALVVPAQSAGTADDIAIFHTADGAFYALDDTCTHEEASLADGWVEGDVVECPLHSAEFCLRTGAALCLPATVPAVTHAVEVRGDDVYLFPGVPAANS